MSERDKHGVRWTSEGGPEGSHRSLQRSYFQINIMKIEQMGI